MKTQDLLAELQLIAKLLDKSKKHHEGGEYEAHAAAKNARLVLEKVIQKIAARENDLVEALMLVVGILEQKAGNGEFANSDRAAIQAAKEAIEDAGVKA